MAEQKETKRKIIQRMNGLYTLIVYYLVKVLRIN